MPLNTARETELIDKVALSHNAAAMAFEHDGLFIYH